MAKKNRLLLCQSSAVGNLSILYNLLFYVTSLLLKKKIPSSSLVWDFLFLKGKALEVTFAGCDLRDQRS